jgi:hypothetical protein
VGEIDRLTDDEMVERGIAMQKAMTPISTVDAIHLCLSMAAWGAVQCIDVEQFVDRARESFFSARRRYRERKQVVLDKESP